MIRGLGVFNDSDVIAGCRERFDKSFKQPGVLPPDLRPTILAVVGRYANAQTWEKLHQLGVKSMSLEEKQYTYEALASGLDPKLVQRTLPLAVSDELPVSRAPALVPFVARESEHPELAWDFARKNMKALLAKQDALGINSYAAGVSTYFSTSTDAEALKSYAKASLPGTAEKAVKKAVDEIEFRTELKQRLLPELKAWTEKKS